jgi:hypothetical protein
MRVLVTGGAGFVGSHLVDRLMEQVSDYYRRCCCCRLRFIPLRYGSMELREGGGAGLIGMWSGERWCLVYTRTHTQPTPQQPHTLSLSLSHPHPHTQQGHEVIVVDNMFTGRKKNVAHWIGHPNFMLIVHDVVEPIMLEVGTYGVGARCIDIHIYTRRGGGGGVYEARREWLIPGSTRQCCKGWDGRLAMQIYVTYMIPTTRMHEWTNEF